ncbi:MAG TPA: MarR family transcriptional regulator [Gaiellaceae bacterium]|jgi:DNA-binding MarR family transcriptional regulator|nr:MarR family transcriptional regulator [Gaiellaceae bacterium]
MSTRNTEVADRLHSAAIHLLRRAAEEDKAAGLSRARLSALSVVVFRGPLTLGELATAEGVRSATMTGIVNGLESDGLVRRRPHGRDKRSVNIEATGAGRRLLDRARARRIDHVVSRLDDLPDDDLELLARAAELLDERFSL